MEVRDHTGQGATVAEWGEMSIVVFDGQVLESFSAFGTCQKPAQMEWIDEHLLSGCLPPADEVSRHADSDQRQAQSPADQQVDDAERNGDASTEIHHTVEVAVLWVEIVGLVADEAEFPEQHLIEGIDGNTWTCGVTHGVANPIGPVIELSLEALDIEAGIGGEGESPDSLLQVEVFALGQDKCQEFRVPPIGGVRVENLEHPSTDEWDWMQGVLFQEI